MTELLIGARMALTGGREGWIRTILTALGVGIGVAMLLLAASVPAALQAREHRGDARNDLFGSTIEQPAANTLLLAVADTEFRGTEVRGRLVEAEGPDAPVLPGLTKLPAIGEVAVSPALRDLLATPDGQRLFAPRLGGATVTATIGDEGLLGPGELVFIRGVDLDPAEASRLDQIGDFSPDEPQSPILTFLVVVIFVVLLLPIGVFLGAAVRFGGVGRDRRLAAVRLLGADPPMPRLIAGGEAAVGALLGLVVGAGLFALGRQLVPRLTLWDISVFAADVRPAPALVAVIAVTVPAVAVLVSLLALRGVLIEPLGVTRKVGGPRRRLWWRLLLPGAGLALLWPLVGDVRDGMTDFMMYQIAAGATLMLLGAVTLLPWLVDLIVRRLSGGAVAWQLAVRRLQLDSATSARLVNGIAVAVAGAIGLQMLFAAVQRHSTVVTGEDTSRAHAVVLLRAPAGGAGTIEGQLRAVPGVATASTTIMLVHDPAIRVGDCAALAELATLDRCADGDTFLVQGGEGDETAPVAPGTRLRIEENLAWTVPKSARTVPSRVNPTGGRFSGILATPGAFPDLARLTSGFVTTYLTFDPTEPDAPDFLRAAVEGHYPDAQVSELRDTRQVQRFQSIQRALYAGVVVTLLLIAGSMLVGIVEHLRERRRLLAMLVAVGTPRATLGWSVLWQSVVPVAIGLVLATAFGLSLGAVLLRMTGIDFSVDWSVVGLTTSMAAGVVLLVTTASLPVLWRLTRPGGLRTE